MNKKGISEINKKYATVTKRLRETISNCSNSIRETIRNCSNSVIILCITERFNNKNQYTNSGQPTHILSTSFTHVRDFVCSFFYLLVDVPETDGTGGSCDTSTASPFSNRSMVESICCK